MRALRGHLEDRPRMFAVRKLCTDAYTSATRLPSAYCPSNARRIIRALEVIG